MERMKWEHARGGYDWHIELQEKFGYLLLALRPLRIFRRLTTSDIEQHEPSYTPLRMTNNRGITPHPALSWLRPCNADVPLH